MKTIWMSFVDGDRPKGERFLGVAIVDVSPEDEAAALEHYPEMHDKVKGPVIVAAALIAKGRNCNPGGEIQAMEMKAPVADQYKYVLMNPTQLAEAGFIEGPKESIH